MQTKRKLPVSKTRRRLQTYIFIVFLGASVLPLIVSSAISYSQSKHMILEAALTSSDQSASLSMTGMNGTIEQIGKVFMQLAANTELSAELEKTPDGELEEFRRMNFINENILEQYLALYPFIRNLIIYPQTASYAIVSGNDGFSVTRNFEQFKTYQRALQNPLRSQWQGLHTYEGNYYSYVPSRIISFSQAVNRPSSRPFVVEIHIKQSAFDDRLKNSHDSYHSSIFLLDNEGKLLSANENLQQEQADAILHENSENYIIKQWKLANGWEYIYAIPLAELGKSTQIQLYSTMATTLIYVLLAALLAALTSVMVTHPIKQMITNMNTPLDGETHREQYESRIWEIAYLDDAYHEMRERTKRLITGLLAEQVKKQEAEMRVLQAQVNPHFLYNSLNMIRCSAALNGQEEIQKMTVALISILEFSINSRECVRVEDEISVTRQYVALQECRNNQKMHIDISVTDGLEKSIMLKMSLLPLVENAILHAYSGREDEVKIRVRIFAQNDKMMVEVEDFGNGMTQQRVSEIFGHLDKDRKFNRIGLRNIIDRIQLYFGSAYSLRIHSCEGSGTTVCLEHPILTEEDWDRVKGQNHA